MLAIAWPWADFARDRNSKLYERLGASLCAGIGGHAGAVETHGLHAAYRPLHSTAALSRSWRPASLPSGRIVIFHGYIDNAATIASQLDAHPNDLGQLYGLAVERWGDAAGLQIVGEYCAVIADPDRFHLRLCRSPLRAPPLLYSQDDKRAAVASVPRALFAAGIERKLNEARVADSAMVNFSDEESSWFEGILRVPVGSVVELERDAPHVVRNYYDISTIPDVRMASDADYIARASELLNEGVRACLAGFHEPGATLSGGLDSPQVAVRALAALPKGQQLPTFTFHPEAGYDGRVQVGMIGNERPFVEAFAAMHPGLEPHFTANEGYEHDHRWNDFFHLMGGAPAGLCNMYVFHGLLAGAKKRGCDVLLLSEWGNYTFSNKGDWGFVEYLLKGRWRQLWMALARLEHDGRPFFSRFLARSILGLMPDPIWRFVRRLAKPRNRALLDLMQPLTREFRIASGADNRLKASGMIIERYQPRSSRHAQRLLFKNSDGEGAEIYQAFEQMYGVALRDPMAYRPFVEFCFGLPVEMFMRDGHMRWLAKQMAKGIMPEEQRDNRLNGRWDADWYLRISRRRQDYIAEFDRLARDERIAATIDLPRLRASLEDWPEQTEIESQKFFAREFAVPRGLLAARFINYVEGRNDL